MNPTIIAAIISASAALVTAIATLLIKEYIEQRPLGKITGRRRALVGKWRGPFHQDFGRDGKPIDIEVTVEFTTSGRKIIGKATLPLPGRSPTTLNFVGGFYHEQFAKLDYTNPDDTIMQFGTYIATLRGEGKVLEGRFLGYGPDTEDIVLGTANLRKEA